MTQDGLQNFTMEKPITIEKIYEANSLLEMLLVNSKSTVQQNKLMNQLIGTIYKGGEKEKSLAIQLIVRHIQKFPNLRRDVFSAILKVSNIKMDNQMILKIAKTSLTNSTKIRDSISDLVTVIVIDVASRDTLIDKSLWIHPLVESFNNFQNETLCAIFSAIDPKINKNVTINFIKFLLDDFRKQSEKEKWTKEIETMFLEGFLNILPFCDKTHLKMLMPTLCLRIKNMERKIKLSLLEMFIEKSELVVPFKPSKVNYEWLEFVLKHSLFICSGGVPSTQLVEYVCLNVIDHISNFDLDDSDLQLNILISFALLCRYCGSIIDILTVLDSLYDGLLLYLPLPIDDKLENITEEIESNIQLDIVECFLFAFHKIASQKAEFLNDSNRMKDFRKRLQFAAFCARNHLKVLTTSKETVNMDDEQKNWRSAAIKTVKNIDILIKDLMHVPPSYKANCQLSTEVAHVTAVKHQIGADTLPISPMKKMKTTQSVYAPPTGKFSEKAGRFFQPNTYGRGRGFSRNRVNFQRGSRGNKRGTY